MQEAQAKPSRLWKSALVWLATVLVGISGGCVGVLFAGHVDQRVGPLQTTFSAKPSWAGRTHIEVAPLGALSMRTHDGPARLDIRVNRVELPQAQQLLADNSAADHLQTDVERDAKQGLKKLIVRVLIVATVGGAIAGLIARRDSKTVAIATAAALLSNVIALGIAASTFRPEAIEEPSYSGMLTLAPNVIGDFKGATGRFGIYRQQINMMVKNVSTIYQATSAIPETSVNDHTVRILHVSDLHLNPAAFDLIAQMVKEFKISVIIDTGDINDWGTEFESSFTERIGKLGVPYIYVRGNHDSKETQAIVAAQPNATVLDNGSTNVDGINIWGTGDTRLSPDKSNGATTESDRAAVATMSANNASALSAIDALGQRPDVALVHDPATAARLGGLVPLVLAGHVHAFSEQSLGSTLALTEGSTGGAGLRSVTNGVSAPLECSVLYWDQQLRRLVAYDHVRVAGLGGAGAQIERRVIDAQRLSQTTASSAPLTPAPPAGTVAPTTKP